MVRTLLESRLNMKVDRSLVSYFFMETGWQDEHRSLNQLKLGYTG
jgi:hypothetical protein